MKMLSVEQVKELRGRVQFGKKRRQNQVTSQGHHK
jgi:hypothetical protein